MLQKHQSVYRSVCHLPWTVGSWLNSGAETMQSDTSAVGYGSGGPQEHRVKSSRARGLMEKRYKKVQKAQKKDKNSSVYFLFFFKPYLPFYALFSCGGVREFSTHLLCQSLLQTLNVSSAVVTSKRKLHSSFIDLLSGELASLDTQERTKPTRFTSPKFTSDTRRYGAREQKELST